MIARIHGLLESIDDGTATGNVFRADNGQPAFVELVPRGADASGRIEVVLRNERRLLVGADIEPELLARMAAALDP